MKDKMPFYNIANMFFVGSIFTFIILTLFHSLFRMVDVSAPIFAFLRDWSVVVSAILLIVMYEIGFILNRASSILIEPILTKTKIWPKYEYDKDVSEISEKNSKFQSMITELVLMRTHVLLYLITTVLSFFSPYKWFSGVSILLVILFVLSGRKHNAKINKIRKSTEEEQKESDKVAQEIRNFLSYDGSVQEKKYE